MPSVYAIECQEYRFHAELYRSGYVRRDEAKCRRCSKESEAHTRYNVKAHMLNVNQRLHPSQVVLLSFFVASFLSLATSQPHPDLLPYLLNILHQLAKSLILKARAHHIFDSPFPLLVTLRGILG